MEKTGYYFKDKMLEKFGRRRGQLWRSERDWYATDTKSDGAIKAQMEEAMRQHMSRVEGLHNRNGMTHGKGLRYAGCIPSSVYIAHPELGYDDNAVRQFFEDHPKFAIPKGRK